MENIFDIFTESSENDGILYDSYEPLLKVINDFLNTVTKNIDQLIDNPTKNKIDLSSDLKQFKHDIKKKMIPQPIDVNKINKTVSKIKGFSKDIDIALKKYAKLKNKIAFGGNYLRAVINKPKVYIKDIDEKKYDVENNNIRQINYAMDWIEKGLLDLYNLADQDLNILTVVNAVYAKTHIFESVPAGVICEDDATLVGMLPGAGNPKIVKEASFNNNTRDKKTSHVPAYIANNHDMASYGEEEPEEKEKSLEDYRRPSAPNKDEKPEKDEDEIKPYQEPDEAPEISKPVATPASPNHTDATTPEGKAIQNYYYYTYNNSMNKHDNHSVHTQDDHSQHNSNNGYHSSKKEDEFHSVESANPWELNLGLPEMMMEGKMGHFEIHNPEHSIEDMERREKVRREEEEAYKQIKPTSNFTFKDAEDFWDKFFADDYKKEDGNELDIVTLSDPLKVKPAEEPKRIQFKDLPEDKKRFIMDLFSEAAGRNPKIVKVDRQAQNVLEKSIANRIKSGTDKTMKIDDLPGWDDESEEKTESTIDKDTFKKMVRDKVNKGETFSLKELEAIDDEIRIIPDDKRKPNEPMKIVIFDEANTNEVDTKDFPEKIQLAFGNQEFEFPIRLQSYITQEEFDQTVAKLKELNWVIDPALYTNKIVSYIDDREIEWFLNNVPNDAKSPRYTIDEVINKFKISPGECYIKKHECIGFTFGYDLDPEHGLGMEINLNTSLCVVGDSAVGFDRNYTESLLNESKEEPTGFDKPTAGEADDMKPKSDHPIKDVFMDIDRKSTNLQQGAKKAVQDAQNVVRAAVKPIKRTQDWIGSMVAKWKDADETNIKEKMADPMARKGLLNAFKKAIEVGALFKAGILLNPIFLFLTITKKINNKKNEYRIRNEMISELKTEMDIIDEKIKDAAGKDNKAKYELMRLKNEINKKLLRVAGADSNWAKKVI